MSKSGEKCYCLFYQNLGRWGCFAAPPEIPKSGSEIACGWGGECGGCGLTMIFVLYLYLLVSDFFKTKWN